jgi:hypothetical protein
MTAQIIRGVEVNRPEPAALISTVLDHATVVENTSFGLRNNVGLWPSYNCLDLLIPTPICPDPIMEADFKTFSVAGWVPGFEFAVHGGVQCAAVGLDKADQLREVERVFSRSEAKGVEMALLANRFVENAPGSEAGNPMPTEWEAPVDLSAAGMTLIGAFAALEGYAASVYAGVPTIHAPRAAVLAASGAGLIVERDGKFYTKTGAKVAAGGGYDSEEVPDGTYDLYVTGEVYVERSEEFSHQTYVLPGDGSGIGSDENGLADNTVITLVERMFRVGVDCFVAKATGRLWSA